MEDQLIGEANQYDTGARRDQKQGMAMADVTATFDATRRNALSRLEGYGVDPSQTRNAALDIGVRTQQAAAMAAAATAAGNRVEDTGRALRSDVVNFGKGLPMQTASSYNQSVAAGQSAVGGANSTTNTGINALTSGQAFTGQGMAANNQAGSLMNTQFGNQQSAATMSNANSAAMASNIMGGVGMAAGMGMKAGMMADGGKVGPRSALPVGLDATLEHADRHIAETYGAGEYNTSSKLIPGNPMPTAGAAMRGTALPPRGGAQNASHSMRPQHYADAGHVDTGPTDGTGIDDQVPAMLSVGEFVIPADVVAAKGKEFFERMLTKYHKPAAQQRADMMGA